MKHFIKKNWKPLAFWSGLGGIAVGTTMYMMRRQSSRLPAPILLPEEIPEIVLKTRLSGTVDAEDAVASGEYHLQKTQFRIWSLLGSSEKGHPVFYVIPTQIVGGDDPSGQSYQKDPFYSVVGVPAFSKRGDLLNHVRFGSPLVFHPCLVGGGINAIWSGEKIITRGVLVDIQKVVPDI